MVHIKPALSSLLILLFLFSPITTASDAAFPLPFPGSYSQYKTFISLATSLFSRVSNQCTARGDIACANRAKLIAQSLERGLYVYDAVSELNPLTFISLTPSLFSRVSNLRAERGDIAGANRAKLIARSLERVLYVYGAVSELNPLLGFLSDFGRAGSEIENFERTTWVARNYRNVLKVATSVSEFNQLLGFLSDFGRAGSEIERTTWVQRNYRNALKDVLKEVVEMVQTEVREGDLLRDCLEVGSGDLQGLVQIIKDVASQYYPTSSNYNSEL